MALLNPGELLVDTVLADVTFVVEDEEIPGHRLLFAKACDYFQKLLYGDFRESQLKRIELNGTSVKLFKEVKRFIYLGELQVATWKIEDLLGLMSLAHEYQFSLLFSEVTKAFEQQTLDFDTWNLVNSAAALYNCDVLKAKCSSFAAEKFDDFLQRKDLEMFSFEFICWMLDSVEVSTYNQDQLLGAICETAENHSVLEVISLYQKISWENVSPKFSADILKCMLKVAQYSFELVHELKKGSEEAIQMHQKVEEFNLH